MLKCERKPEEMGSGRCRGADSYMNWLTVVGFLHLKKKKSQALKYYRVTGLSFYPSLLTETLAFFLSPRMGGVSVASTVVGQQTPVTPKNHGTLLAWTSVLFLL